MSIKIKCTKCGKEASFESMGEMNSLIEAGWRGNSKSYKCPKCYKRPSKWSDTSEWFAKQKTRDRMHKDWDTEYKEWARRMFLH